MGGCGRGRAFEEGPTVEIVGGVRRAGEGSGEVEAARNEEGAMGERVRVCVGGMEQEEQGWVGGKSSRPHSSSSSVRAPRNVRILGLGLRKVRIQNVVGVCVCECAVLGRWVGGEGGSQREHHRI